MGLTPFGIFFFFFLWDLDLDLLGLHMGLHTLQACTQGLDFVGLHRLQALLMPLDKAHIL